mmetsp:Transcript_17879/g.44330  ORF Transcript_17879/g.44330 Transcript_17879/m.44330 type:complete len:720 (-) Transcript_17879:1147-3306(-)
MARRGSVGSVGDPRAVPYDGYDDDDGRSQVSSQDGGQSAWGDSVNSLARKRNKIAKLQRLVQLSTTKLILRKLKSFVFFSLAAAFTLALVCFISSEISHESEVGEMNQLAEVASIAVHTASINALALELWTSIRANQTNNVIPTGSWYAGVPIGYELRTIDVVKADMDTEATNCLEKLVAVSLGTVNRNDLIVDTTYGVLDRLPTPFKRYLTSQEAPILKNLSSYEAIHEYCTKAQFVAQSDIINQAELEHDPDWRAVIQNFWSPIYEALENLMDSYVVASGDVHAFRLTLRYILLGIDVVFLVVIMSLLLRKYLPMVVADKVRLFQLFVRLPLQCMRVMLAEKQKVGDETDSDSTSSASDSGDEKKKKKGKHEGGEGKDKDKKKSSAAGGKKKKKALNYDRHLTGIGQFDSNRYVLPLLGYAVFSAYTFIIFLSISPSTNAAITSVRLSGRGALSAASLRSIAIETSLLPYWNDTAADGSVVSPRGEALASLRSKLGEQISLLESTHDSLVHSDEEGTLSMLFSSSQRSILVDPQCLRSSNASCLPVGHPFYTETTSGLDALVKDYIENANALYAATNSTTSTQQAVLRLDSQVFGFVWQVGVSDIVEGLASSKSLLVNEGYIFLGIEAALEGTGLGVLVIAIFIYYWRWLKPFLQKTEQESHRAAAMISVSKNDRFVTSIPVTTASSHQLPLSVTGNFTYAHVSCILHTHYFTHFHL